VDSDYTFGLLNELGNVLRSHQNLGLAEQFYKKALLNVKRKYKTKYLGHLASAKILVNLASLNSLKNDHIEAAKFYRHALEVLKNSETHEENTQVLL